MPRIRRWHPVSHDLNGDPEVWELTDRFGDRALRVWLEILSITDRTSGVLRGHREYIESTIGARCRMAPKTIKRILDYALEKSWLLSDGILRTRNYSEFHRNREPKKPPVGNEKGSLPSEPSEPSEPSVLHKSIIPVAVIPWPDSLRQVETRLNELKVCPALRDPEYWQRIHDWIESTKLPIFYLDELKAYLANQAGKNGHQKHKNLKQGFRNWLSTAVRWKERDADRKAITGR